MDAASSSATACSSRSSKAGSASCTSPPGAWCRRLRSMGIRVVVADDSLLVREGVRALLGDHSDLSTIGLAADYDELLRLVAELAPDVVVTDICMPPGLLD